MLYHCLKIQTVIFKPLYLLFDFLNTALLFWKSQTEVPPPAFFARSRVALGTFGIIRTVCHHRSRWHHTEGFATMSNIPKQRELITASPRHNEKHRRVLLLILWIHNSIHLFIYGLFIPGAWTGCVWGKNRLFYFLLLLRIICSHTCVCDNDFMCFLYN